MICSGWNKGLTKENNIYYDKMYSKERNKKISNCFKGKSLQERYGEEQANKFIQRLKETGSKLKGRKSGIFKKCLICNKEIYCYNFEKEWKKFCSRECFNIWQKDNTKLKGNKIRLGLPAWNKGKSYTIKNRTYKICPICKKEFTDLPYLIKDKIYCSIKCSSKRPKTEKQLIVIRKNGLKKKGIKLSEEHRKKISKAKEITWKDKEYRDLKLRQMEKNWEIIRTWIGEKHPNWLGGKSFEPYTKEFNDKFRELIRQRDNYTCLKCGLFEEDCKKLYKQNLHIHHINYDKKLTIKENCCALCLRCNVEVNKNRKHWIKFFQSILNEKYGYIYQDGKVVFNIEQF